MSLSSWLDDRTGYRRLTTRAFDEEIQGGARWTYVFGSGLLALFLMEGLTGLLLMAKYTPSVDDAWSSVFYIQHKMAGGWFIRGLHRYGADAMIIVLGLHMLQVVAYGAYKRPREVNWWLGLVLLGLVQGAALTGYVLPWDQAGYWASNVRTQIMASLPVIGPTLHSLVVGGSEYGQETLTHFYALHVGLMPMLMVLTVVAHVAMFRRHGPTKPVRDSQQGGKQPFYPAQAARDIVFVVFVLSAVAVVATVSDGGPLSAPADPSVQFPPRPEWFHRFLNKILMLLPPSLEILGTVVLPGVVSVFLFALPLIDRSPSTRVRDRLEAVTPLALGMLAIVGLTAWSFYDDSIDEEYQESKREAEERAQRAIALAQPGIPPGGPLEMLANDPMTEGKALYIQYCRGCHILDGEGEREAPDHTNFASREWIRGLVHDPTVDEYFGTTGIDEMKPMGEKLTDEEMNAVVEFLFAQGREPQDPPVDEKLVEEGAAVFDYWCMDCHTINGEGSYIGLPGPDMTNYASREWIWQQIATPAASHQYGEELNEMPPFKDELTDQQIDMVAAFTRLLRFEDREAHALHPLMHVAEDATEKDGPDELAPLVKQDMRQRGELFPAPAASAKDAGGPDAGDATTVDAGTADAGTAESE